MKNYFTCRNKDIRISYNRRILKKEEGALNHMPVIYTHDTHKGRSASQCWSFAFDPAGMQKIKKKLEIKKENRR